MSNLRHRPPNQRTTPRAQDLDRLRTVQWVLEKAKGRALRQAVQAATLKFRKPQSTIYRWVAAFKKSKSDVRAFLLSYGHKSGRPHTLNRIQESEVAWAMDYPPSKYGLRAKEWNTAAIMAFVWKRFKIRISESTAWRIMNGV